MIRSKKTLDCVKDFREKSFEEIREFMKEHYSRLVVVTDSKKGTIRGRICYWDSEDYQLTTDSTWTRQTRLNPPERDSVIDLEYSDLQRVVLCAN